MNKYSYKKQIGFMQAQKESMLKLKEYGVNVNQFIRQAVKEKIQREWPGIKAKKTKDNYPF